MTLSSIFKKTTTIERNSFIFSKVLCEIVCLFMDPDSIEPEWTFVSGLVRAFDLLIM